MSKHAMPSFTPGPWHVRDARTEDEGVTYGALIVQSRDCGICDNVTNEHDAALIASAPQLLEALEQLLAADRADIGAIVGRDVDGHPLNAAGVARMNARAAIKAAKGEA